MGNRKFLPLALLGACTLCALLAVACQDAAPAPQQQAATVEQTPTLDGGNLPIATVEQAYAAAINLPAPGECRITSGALPPGVTLAADGRIEGTPQLTGDWRFEVTVQFSAAVVKAEYVLPVAGALGDIELEHELRALTNAKRLIALISTDKPELDPARVELGRALFFDKILSGHRDVACATCHHPAHGFTDGLSLSVGVGANGVVGPGRRHGAGVLIPRNSPAIFYSGMMASMFWDVRVRLPLDRQGNLPPVGTPVETPEGPMRLAPDEAQALFPLVDIIEMRGEGHELDGLSDSEYRLALVDRLKALPEYVAMFEAAFGTDGMTVENMGRAIAAYERTHTYVNSPWDRYLLGERAALTDTQKRGAALFFGRANCDNCHNGPLLSDFSLRNVMVPQIGPGRGTGQPKGEDYGVEDVIGRSNFRFTFRTPPLRQVALTAPYMHNGAFNTLREVVLHYRDKEASLLAFDKSKLGQAWDLYGPADNAREVARRRSFPFTLVPGDLTDEEVDQIVAFLETLTDPAAVNPRHEIPPEVPSGLPVDR